MAANTDDVKTMIDVEKMRSEIRMDLLQERHWDVQQAHRTAQQKHWKYIFIAAVIAVIINGLKPLWT